MAGFYAFEGPTLPEVLADYRAACEAEDDGDDAEGEDES